MFLSRYIDYLTFERRYSPHTISGYQNEVEKFHAYLEQLSTNIDQVHHSHFRSYFAQSLQGGAHPSSVNRSISALKNYFAFLKRACILEVDPTKDLKTLKKPKRLPTVVEPLKLEALLDDQQLFSDDFPGRRDKLVMEMLFGTGMRLSELLHIQLGDLNLPASQVLVTGKRNKQRLLPLHATLMTKLREYLQLRSELDTDTTHLILTNKGLPAYEKLIYRTVQKYLTLISTQKKCSPHILRHTFATAMLDKGADLNAIKELLGHTGLASTQVYTHNSAERLKSIYEQAHPRA